MQITITDNTLVPMAAAALLLPISWMLTTIIILTFIAGGTLNLVQTYNSLTEHEKTLARYLKGDKR